jgi:hypothetical protein
VRSPEIINPSLEFQAMGFASQAASGTRGRFCSAGVVGNHWVVCVQRFLGVDLAWSVGRDGGAINQTGLVCLDRYGHVLAARGGRAMSPTP